METIYDLSYAIGAFFIFWCIYKAINTFYEERIDRKEREIYGGLNQKEFQELIDEQYRRGQLGLKVWEVVVNADECTGCEKCVNVCISDVFQMQEGKAVVVNEDLCWCCEECIEVCPPEAITLYALKGIKWPIFRKAGDKHLEKSWWGEEV